MSHKFSFSHKNIIIIVNMDEEPDDKPPSNTKQVVSKVNATPSKSVSKVREVTPKAANTVSTPMMRQGFCYSIINFEFEALLYTTICPDELAWKLENYKFQWEGYGAPTYTRGCVDDDYGMCHHCKRYRWGCHKQKYGRYCVEAVKRFFEWRYSSIVTVKDAMVVFINYYNRPLDYCEFDKLDDPDKEEQPYLDNMEHKYPPKCMEVTSLLHILQWAYWKEEKRKAKIAKKRAAREASDWIETKPKKNKK